MERCQNHFDYRLMHLSDGKLLTQDGKEFHIHKFMLAKNSKYFYELFCGLEQNKKEFLIPGVRSDVLKTILSYIYTGNMCVTDENICELIIASNYLMVDNFLSEVKYILSKKLSIGNSLSLLMSALKLNRGDFIRETYRFVQTHFEKILCSGDMEFGKLPLETLEQLLSDRNLCVRNERTVWLAIIQWIETDSFQRLSFVPDLMTHLNICDVNEDLAKEILEHDIVANNPFCFGIADIKSSYSNISKVEIIQRYIQSCHKPITSIFNHRLPSKLNCIICYCTCAGADAISIHLTYDENRDLWREVLEAHLGPEFLVCSGDSVYMLRTKENRNFRYSLVEDQWYELNDFLTLRYNYAIVELNGCIYALGGSSTHTGKEIYDVEIYDSAFDIWYYTTPMIPVSCFSAVSLNNSIYVVGYRLNRMISEVYDSLKETWNLLPAVSINRYHFALAAYRGEIYVIGGKNDEECLKDVEVFDPEKNEWKIESSLPCVYYFPKAIVLDDVLIVYDNHVKDHEYQKSNRPVFWNPHQSCWKHLDESSPLNNLHLYEILSVENTETVSHISNENRHPGTDFERSPFN